MKLPGKKASIKLNSKKFRKKKKRSVRIKNTHEGREDESSASSSY
jgi:hypothetical protein